MATSLTRQHFRAFAAEIAAVDNVAERIKLCQFCCRVLPQFNPRFSRSRFESACNISFSRCPFCGLQVPSGVVCSCMGGK